MTSAFERLEDRVQTLTNLEQAQEVLHWDQEVMMPEGGTPARSQQLGAISSTRHRLLTDEKTGTLLDEVDQDALDAEQQAVVREVRREYERQQAVPATLVEKLSAERSEAMPAWKQAKANDDFSTFAPHLETLIELRKEYAHEIDPDTAPYAVLFADYEPYLDFSTAEDVLARLRDVLVPLIDDIRASDADIATDVFHGDFTEDQLDAVHRDVLDVVGYDWEHGRLDTSPHPFSTGNQFDARITTRYDTGNLMDGLSSVIHEFGHALYSLNVPKEHYGTPLGSAREMTVHESQSRFWENHVGRSEAFWQCVLPILQEHADGFDDATSREAFQAANQVHDDNLIRVEADELTYHTHIVVRFEIEQMLFNDDLAVQDVPQVWNEKMDELLGIRPDTDANGCLQDIHWSHGSFGYFPTYSMGSVLAAQINAALQDDLGPLDQYVREGDLSPVRDWLARNVHRHGQRYTTPDLIEEATGEPLTVDHFVSYAEKKYGTIYGL